MVIVTTTAARGRPGSSRAAPPAARTNASARSRRRASVGAADRRRAGPGAPATSPGASTRRRSPRRRASSSTRNGRPGASSQVGRGARRSGLYVPQCTGTTSCGSTAARGAPPRSGSRWPSPSVEPHPQIGSERHVDRGPACPSRRTGRCRRRSRRDVAGAQHVADGVGAHAAVRSTPARVHRRHRLDRQRSEVGGVAGARLAHVARSPCAAAGRRRRPAPTIGDVAVEQPQRRDVQVVDVDVRDQDHVGLVERRRRRSRWWRRRWATRGVSAGSVSTTRPAISIVTLACPSQRMVVVTVNVVRPRRPYDRPVPDRRRDEVVRRRRPTERTAVREP